MHDRLILTHNLGTTGDKAVLYDEQGEIVRSWLTRYKASYSDGNRVEQNPQDWWNAVCESTRNVMRGINEKSIAVVSFSGQMMGCLCVDKAGDPIGNAIIWADMRAQLEADALNEVIDENQFYRITGHRISSAYTLSKLLWIKNNLPEVYQKTAKVLQAKDYIVYRLTNRLLTDYSDATGTNLFNLTNREWSRTILSITGINRDLLPEAVPCTTIAGHISLEAAGATGLLPGTPVVLGAGDGLCAAIGAGCTEPRDAYLYFGSSAWIGVTSREPFFDPALRTFNWAHVDRDLVSPCGTMQAAGASLDWQRDQLALVEAIQAETQGCKVQDLIDLEVRQSPPGANGLLFLPYLLGERSPYWNPAAKGSLLGLNKKHIRADIFRACIEGVVLNLKIIWNTMQPVVDSKELVLTGGQSSSDVNKQIVADVLGIPVVTHNHLRDSKNFGAAMIGGVGIGLFGQVSDVRSLLRMEEAFQPNPVNTAFYNRLLPVFEDSYHALKTIYGQLDQVKWNENEQEGS